MNTATETGNIKTFDDVTNLLDTDLTDLADLAAFKVPAAGRYTFSVDAETKEINQHPAVILNYSVMEIIELADPESTPPTIGDKFGESFMIDNEFGTGKLKKALKPYADAFSVTNIGQLLGMIDGVVVDGTVKRREDKEKLDDDGNPRVYGSIVNIEVK